VLEFTLSNGASVRLALVNMLSMLVRKVVDDELGPGLHSYPVDTSELPRGMYLCILQAGSKESVRTMIVK